MTCMSTLPFKSSTVFLLERNSGCIKKPPWKGREKLPHIQVPSSVDFIPISVTCFCCLKQCQAFISKYVGCLFRITARINFDDAFIDCISYFVVASSDVFGVVVEVGVPGH